MTLAKKNIGIAGAGISGLSAGILLQHYGHSVQIFESRLVCGGRIQSQKLNGYLIESGPEFIHGRAKETLSLLNKYKIPFLPVKGKMYEVTGGQIRESDEISEHWNVMLNQMQNLESDLPFGKFLTTHFPGLKFKTLRDSATGFAQGFDLADLAKVSTKALAVEWSSWEDEQYRIPDGYDTLIRCMENEFISAGGKILFGHVVKSVDWSEKTIRVVMESQQPITVDKLMVSLPVPMLRQTGDNWQKLLFNPSPKDKLEIFDKIGYGTVVKLVMIWKSVFWKKNFPSARFIFSSGFISTWWTQFPLDNPVLTGWLGGPEAEKFSNQPDEFFLRKGLETLSSVFSIAVPELKNQMVGFRVFNWKNEIWSRGAYSYPTVQSREAKLSAMKSWSRRIYFAGEAFYEGVHPGTVEAALVSGADRARQLLKEM